MNIFCTLSRTIFSLVIESQCVHTLLNGESGYLVYTVDVFIIGLLFFSKFKFFPQETGLRNALWHLNTGKTLKTLDETRKFPCIETQFSFPIVLPTHHLYLSDFVTVATNLEIRSSVFTSDKVMFWGERAESGHLFYNLHPPKFHIRFAQSGHNWDPKNKAQGWDVGVRIRMHTWEEGKVIRKNWMPTTDDAPPYTHVPHHAHIIPCTHVYQGKVNSSIYIDYLIELYL